VVEGLTRKAFEARWKGAEVCDWSGGEGAERRSGGGARDGADRVRLAEFWKRETVSRSLLALSNGQVVGQDVYEREKALFDAAGATVVGRPRPATTHKVTQYILSGAEVLETVDWAGRYIPIVPVYGEAIHVDGARRLRSLVRDAKDPQRMYNYWRTASTELVALAPKTPSSAGGGRSTRMRPSGPAPTHSPTPSLSMTARKPRRGSPMPGFRPGPCRRP